MNILEDLPYEIEYIEPKTNNDAYNAAYQNWKKTLINKLNNDTYRR